MSSSDSDTELDLDLEFGIETTPEDVEALRKHRPSPMSFEAYFVFLRRFPDVSTEELRRRRGPRGEPFVLPLEE